MKRVKRHKVKKEKPESISSMQRDQEEHDLAYYIHDRVELMHQVFSMLKYKELKAMAPECVRNLAIGDLQELCTEELLGISSKRLLAVLDGAEAPSDTESSSSSPPPDELETISLDSISSDEELLALNNKKKKHKHHHRSSKSKSKKKDKPKKPASLVDENAEVSKASRAGLTVLELLELQARARAIRAQLQQEQANKRPSETTAVESSLHSSDNEVEIKEEAADVVEISSEDEKPDINELNKVVEDKTTSSKAMDSETVKESESQLNPQENSQTVTKRVNNLVITVPHAKPTRKIKLNRNKVTVSVTNDSTSISTETRSVAIVPDIVAEKAVNTNLSKNTLPKSNESKAKKKKKNKKKKTVDKDGSDHDEITLQLSDSEKMDLLEDLDESRKNYDKVSSSSEDTESSSSESDNDEIDASKETIMETTISLVETRSAALIDMDKKDENASLNTLNSFTEAVSSSEIVERNENSINSMEATEETDNNVSTEPTISTKQLCKNDTKNTSQNTDNNLSVENEDLNRNNKLEKTNSKKNDDMKNIDSALDSVITDISINQNVTEHEDLIVVNDTPCDAEPEKSSNEDITSNKYYIPSEIISSERKELNVTLVDDIPVINTDATNNTNKESQKDSDIDNDINKETEQHFSDGELSDRQSSEVEAVDIQTEIVCISDEEITKNKLNKKKKKKDKKSKKEKKSKKSQSDFRKGDDHNFYNDADQIVQENDPENMISSKENTVHLDSDDVYEILELSDDSSCYEVEGTVLSKEPTAEEIEALSARIDEIEREEVVTDEQIRAHEKMIAEKSKIQEKTDIENISWKDRYLGSKKVKKVLTTANILNALRKKNKELKKKIEDSKKKDDKEPSNKETIPGEVSIQLEEGSIEQYNALEGSTKYIDPIQEQIEDNKNGNDSKNESETNEILTENLVEECVTKEIKKDAKQLLKMYKKLLKYNDMNKQKDPSKKKKKKQRKKDKLHTGGTRVTTTKTANMV